jgi:hypothetical protein
MASWHPDSTRWGESALDATTQPRIKFSQRLEAYFSGFTRQSCAGLSCADNHRFLYCGWLFCFTSKCLLTRASKRVLFATTLWWCVQVLRGV